MLEELPLYETRKKAGFDWCTNLYTKYKKKINYKNVFKKKMSKRYHGFDEDYVLIDIITLDFLK